jgi:hypothetical protein
MTNLSGTNRAAYFVAKKKKFHKFDNRFLFYKNICVIVYTLSGVISVKTLDITLIVISFRIFTHLAIL